MSDSFLNRVLRPIRVRTDRFTCEGLLSVGLRARTLDELNVGVRSVLHLTAARMLDADLPLGPGPLALNKHSILFVIELPDLGVEPPRTPIEAEIQASTRSAVRLFLGPLRVEGFVHTFAGNDPLSRLNLGGSPFLAVSPAAVRGPGTDLDVSFVAVNRAHIQGGQEIYSVQIAPEECGVAAGADRS